MRIYFSGCRGLTSVPEALICKRNPHVMLTYHDIVSQKNDTIDRLNVYLKRKYGRIYRYSEDVEDPYTKVDHPLFSESIFMDSGAYSLYALHVADSKGKMGKHGRVLERVMGRRWGSGDYSYYSLAPNSEFRAYCDSYAKFMRKLSKTDVLFTTVDAILNPQVSWHISQYFEKEHGLRPVPVIHGCTPQGPRWLDRYLQLGHTLIGFGGLGGSMRKNKYLPWADEMWKIVCPESNKFKPVVRVHGFAMTSWELMGRWPWWSVDSASWTRFAAYGWIIVPRWEQGRFVHNKRPWQINMSRKPTERKHKFKWQIGNKSVRQIKDQHYDNCPPAARESVDRWLAHLGIPHGSYKGEEVTEVGASSDFTTRAKVNLSFYADFQDSLPKWPWSLSKVDDNKVNYRIGFGLSGVSKEKHI